MLKFSGFDTLQGGTGNNTFEVNTTFDGTLNGGGVSTTSPGTAIFDLNTDGSVTGGINGQSGDSTINYSGAVDVIVSGIDSADPPIGYSGNEATSVSGGFTGINEVTAANTGSTLTGDNNASQWTIVGPPNFYQDVTLGNTLSLGFSGFTNLQGGTGNNTFTVFEFKTFAGSFHGGSEGIDTFNLNLGAALPAASTERVATPRSTTPRQSTSPSPVSTVLTRPSATAETRRQAFLAGSRASTKSRRLEARSLVTIWPAPGPSTRPTLTRT